MGINISGFMVRDLDLTKDSDFLENLFNRKVIKSTTRSIDYYDLLYSPNDQDVIVFSNGAASSVQVGHSFYQMADELFVDKNAHEIKGDYLYYSFSETSMMFCLMHRKNGELFEEYHTNGKRVGRNAIGLNSDMDITQDGLDLALTEFGLQFDETVTTVYTFDKPEKSRVKPTTARRSELLNNDQRFYVHDYSVYLMRVMTRQLQASKDRNESFHKKMASIGVQVRPLSFDRQRFLKKSKFLKTDSIEDLKKSRKILIEAIIDEPNGFRYMEELVYVQRLIQMRNEGVENENSFLAWAKLIVGLLITLSALAFTIYRLMR